MGVQSRGPGLVGERLRTARKRRNWTQTELAYHAGMNATEVARYETGIRQPSTPALVRLAQALGESLDYLCGLRDDAAP